MKNGFFRQKLCISTMALALIFGTCGPLWAADADPTVLDVAIKICDIDEKLNLIESLVPTDPNRPKISLLPQLKGMLRGTNWVDPRRSIVFGMIMGSSKSEMAVIIPYRSSNAEFQSATGATDGSNYYVITLPAGNKQGGASSTMLKALESASSKKSEDFMSIDIAVRALLEKGDQKIRESIEKIGTMPDNAGKGNLEVSPQDVKDIANGLVNTGKQLERLKESIDLTEEKISLSLTATAAADTLLSDLFIRGPMMTYLSGYEPDEQINFRSGRYDNQGYMTLFHGLFGNVYEKAGIDFTELTKIMSHFTGEMAGGMSFSEDGVYLEMISVLDDKSVADEFAEKTYLPWLEKYMKSIIGIEENRSGRKIENAFLRAPDTTVEGQKVVGLKMDFPIDSQGTKGTAEGLIPSQMRMASVDRFFLLAPDDERMGTLINTARNLKEELYMGPLFKMDMDLGAYVGAVARMAGGTLDEKDLPKTGKMHFAADAENGQLSASSTISVSDARELVNYSKQLASLGKRPPKAIPAVLPRPLKNVQPEVVVENADYWAEKGSLCATYGNDKAAIKYYHKALKLDPQRSDVYFHLGISYGETGEFEKALDAINQAISLDPKKAVYYYGRGRIYLKFGKEDMAMADFKLAADNGNKDAKAYLGIED